MTVGTAPVGANPSPREVQVDALAEARRKAKRVQAKAGALARELAQLQDHCESHGIDVIVLTDDDVAQ